MQHSASLRAALHPGHKPQEREPTPPAEKAQPYSAAGMVRTQATMAFPEGRLLALREGQLHVLEGPRPNDAGRLQVST